MKNNDLDKSLVEVRKAYRILFDYQTRILDLVHYIGNKTQFSYRGGYSKFSNSGPNNGRGKLDLWSWDWLNFYYYEFNFGTLDIKNDKYTFAIFHLADDGFFIKHKQINNCKKTDLSDFANEEESYSKLIFVLGKNIWIDAWGHNWNSLEFTLNEYDVKPKDDINNRMLFKSYNLNQFDNEENVIKVLNDFKNFCKNNGMEFNINKKII